MDFNKINQFIEDQQKTVVVKIELDKETIEVELINKNSEAFKDIAFGIQINGLKTRNDIIKSLSSCIVDWNLTQGDEKLKLTDENKSKVLQCQPIFDAVDNQYNNNVNFTIE